MGLKQPAGRIKVNTGKGKYDKVNNFNRNSYILLDSEACKYNSEQKYHIEDKTIKIGNCNKAADIISKIKF